LVGGPRKKKKKFPERNRPPAPPGRMDLNLVLKKIGHDSHGRTLFEGMFVQRTKVVEHEN